MSCMYLLQDAGGGHGGLRGGYTLYEEINKIEPNTRGYLNLKYQRKGHKVHFYITCRTYVLRALYGMCSAYIKKLISGKVTFKKSI